MVEKIDFMRRLEQRHIATPEEYDEVGSLFLPTTTDSPPLTVFVQ